MRSTGNRPEMGIAGSGFGNSGLSGLPHNQMDLLQSFRVQHLQDIGVAQTPSEGVMDVEETQGDIMLHQWLEKGCCMDSKSY